MKILIEQESQQKFQIHPMKVLLKYKATSKYILKVGKR